MHYEHSPYVLTALVDDCLGPIIFDANCSCVQANGDQSRLDRGNLKRGFPIPTIVLRTVRSMDRNDPCQVVGYAVTKLLAFAMERQDRLQSNAAITGRSGGLLLSHKLSPRRATALPRGTKELPVLHVVVSWSRYWCLRSILPL